MMNRLIKLYGSRAGSEKAGFTKEFSKEAAASCSKSPKVMSEPSTFRPFIFSVVEDDGANVTIEVSEEDYQADLAAGIDADGTLKPVRHKMKRGGFLQRHSELKLWEKEASLMRWAQ